MKNAALHRVDDLDTALELRRWLGERRPILAVDTETAGLRWWRDPCRLVQLGDEEAAWAIPVDRWAGLAVDLLRDYRGELVMHNAKFDWHVLHHLGVTLDRALIHDTRVSAHLLDPRVTSGTKLKPLAARVLEDPRYLVGENLLDARMKERGWDWDTVPDTYPPYWQYACLDTVLTARVHPVLLGRLNEQERALYDLEREAMMVLADMEERGLRLDLDYCRVRQHQLEDYQEQLRAWAQDEYGVENLGSDPQLAKALEDAGCRITKRTNTGKASVDEESLEGIDHPLAAAALDLRHAQKKAASYFAKFRDFADGEILHPGINPLGARTGRQSVSEPSLQNVPRGPEVRRAFIAREGNRIVCVDFRQMELRILADYADERRLMEALARDEDAHQLTAGLVYGAEEPTQLQRQTAKSATYAKLYGAGVAKFARTARIDQAAARQFMDGYDLAWPGIRRFQQDVPRLAKQRNHRDGRPWVRTRLGRLELADPGYEYKLVNYLIQGTAADAFKSALVRLRRSELDRYACLPIHDEVLFDVPEAEARDFAREAAATMEDRDLLRVPLTCDAEVYDRWSGKYEKEEAA